MSNFRVGDHSGVERFRSKLRRYSRVTVSGLLTDYAKWFGISAFPFCKRNGNLLLTSGVNLDAGISMNIGVGDQYGISLGPHMFSVDRTLHRKYHSSSSLKKDGFTGRLRLGHEPLKGIARLDTPHPSASFLPLPSQSDLTGVFCTT